MTPLSAVLWQISWQVHPAAAVLTVAFALLAILTVSSGRWVTIARGAVVALLLVMLSGVQGVSPHHSQVAADGDTSRDPVLIDVVLPSTAWIGESITVTAVARSSASSDSTSAGVHSVELIDPHGQVLASSPLRHVGKNARDQQQLWTASFSWQPEEPGVCTLAAQLVGQQAGIVGGMASSPLPAVCGVAASPLQVLIIDGPARWETRHLHRLLNSTPGVEAELVLLELGDGGRIPASLSAAAAFDVVVLGAFDPRDLPATAAEAIVAAADQHGLGVLWSLDGRSDLNGLMASPLAELLPCSPQPSLPLLPATSGYLVRSTLAAAGFHWLSPFLRAAEQTQVEIFLPFRTAMPRGTAIAPLVVRPAAANVASQPASEEPAILVDHTATGRIVAVLVETWRYRVAGFSADVDAFWRAVVRFVAEPRAAQRMGRRLAEAAAAAERARQVIRRTGDSTGSTADSEHMAAVTRLRWNHPALILLVIMLALLSWMLAEPRPRNLERDDAA